MAITMLAGVMLGLLVTGAHVHGLDPQYGVLLIGLAALSLLAAAVSLHSRRTFWLGLLTAAFLAGVGRALIIHPPVTPADLAYYNGPVPEGNPAKGYSVTVTGVVSAEPVLSDGSQRLRISARTIKLTQQSQPLAVRGDLFAIASRYPEYSSGELLSLSGHLTAPPSFSSFDYAAFLARQGVFSYISFPKVSTLGSSDQTAFADDIIAQRTAARGLLQQNIAEPQAALAVGVVTGDRSAMSDDALAAFRRSGTTHIIAISGENIALLVGFLWLFYRGSKTKRRMPAWLAALAILLLIAYAIFTGATPSVVRAGIMSTLLLLGPLLGRRYDPVAALALAASVMVLFDPNVLADAGFQLSFLAMLGIAFLSPLILSFFNRFRVPRLLGVPLSVSFGAFAATLPVSALISGQLSLVTPLATLTADFALAPLMVSGIFTIIVAAIAPPLTFLPAGVAWLSSSWLLTGARFWSALPWSRVDVANVTTGHIAAYYSLLILSLLILTFCLVDTGRRNASFAYLRGSVVWVLAAIGATLWAVTLALFLF